LIEHNGLLVCENCSLVAAPVYAPPKLDSSAPIAAPVNPARGFYERAVEAVAGELGLPAKAALELYRRLKALAKLEEVEEVRKLGLTTDELRAVTQLLAIRYGLQLGGEQS
jgi:hypothetical protein